MAIRYSGDVEVRIHHLRAGLYCCKVRAPGLRDTGMLKMPGKPSPAAYDSIARAAIHAAERAHGKSKVPAERRGGRIVVERVFKAPCPVPRRIR